MKLYNQELQKTIDSKQKVVQAPVAKKDTHNHHHDDDDMIEKELKQLLLRSLQINRKLLLERLKVSNVSWNSVGELMISTTKYDATNIIDLVNDVMRNRKYSAPFGWEIFAEQLAKINVPQEMIINKACWNYIMKCKTNASSVIIPEAKELNTLVNY